MHGYTYSGCVIDINCYSTGNLSGSTYVGGILGSGLWWNEAGCTEINCYYLKSVTVTKSSGHCLTIEATGLDTLMQTQIDEINAYIDANQGSEEIDTTGWRKWKLGADGNPCFE